ncbi:MAG: hypothetical protein LBD44_01775 [Spirochaetaceae bacterium]|nr:hypothetical protein [Spirochaetaceae bacterium]
MSYKIENQLVVLAEGICDTLLTCRERDMRIDVPFAGKAWFAVGKDTAKTESGYFIRVYGFCGVTDFRFRSNKKGFTFAVNNSRDPEHIFYQFVSMIQVYRGRKGLEPLDAGYIYDINEAGSPPVTPAGETDGGGRRKLFAAPEKLTGIVKDIYNTLVQDCEKGVHITVEQKRNFWFHVKKIPDTENKKDALLVRGGIGPIGFRFNTDGISAGFEPDDKKVDAENLFYMFINIIAMYRRKRGLAPLDTGVIDRLAEEDSPPVSAENYAEIVPDEKTGRLVNLVTRIFSFMSVMENYGQFCFYVCSEQGQIKNMPLNYIPVYMKLLNTFKTAFSVKRVMLFAVRCSGVQRLFFIDGKNRLFCCKHDGSREFLYERFNFIIGLLGISSNTVTGKLSASLGRPFSIKEINTIFDGKAPLPPGRRVNTKR